MLVHAVARINVLKLLLLIFAVRFIIILQVLKSVQIELQSLAGSIITILIGTKNVLQGLLATNIFKNCSFLTNETDEDGIRSCMKTRLRFFIRKDIHLHVALFFSVFGKCIRYQIRFYQYRSISSGLNYGTLLLLLFTFLFAI